MGRKLYRDWRAVVGAMTADSTSCFKHPLIRLRRDSDSARKGHEGDREGFVGRIGSALVRKKGVLCKRKGCKGGVLGGSDGDGTGKEILQGRRDGAHIRGCAGERSGCGCEAAAALVPHATLPLAVFQEGAHTCMGLLAPRAHCRRVPQRPAPISSQPIFGGRTDVGCGGGRRGPVPWFGFLTAHNTRAVCLDLLCEPVVVSPCSHRLCQTVLQRPDALICSVLRSAVAAYARVFRASVPCL